MAMEFSSELLKGDNRGLFGLALAASVTAGTQGR
jgi:hypothetical protein